MKRIVHIGIWLGLAAWFVVILGFVSSQSEEVLCNRLEVHLDDTVRNRFITPAQVRNWVEEAEPELQGYPLAAIQTRSLEKSLEENPFIRNAEVSKDVSGRLTVRVEQRRPLVRILPRGERGYYLDTEGRQLPLSGNYAPHILVVSGSVPDSLENLFAFCRHLVTDPFWKDQIVQVYMDRGGELELIPRVGAHQILLGDLEHWERKLKNLELLYVQGLPVHGWNSYSTINLKYTNQIICTKR